MAASHIISHSPIINKKLSTTAARSRNSCFRPVKCVSVLDFSAVPSQPDFAKAAKSGNVVPLHSCIFSDQVTPIIAYRCLVKEDDRDAPSFLFESVEPGPLVSTVGRYSVVGAQPSLEIVAKENKVSIMDHEQGTLTKEVEEDPMEIPRRISKGWEPQLVTELPDAFCGGWVGFFSYDTVRYVESKRLPFSGAPKDDRNVPDIHVGVYGDVVVLDHLEKKVHVIHWVRMDRFTSVEDAYSDGMRRLESLVAKHQDIDSPRITGGLLQLETRSFGLALTKSNVAQEYYLKLVTKGKEHIVAGDIFQARGRILVASSPEILTRVKKRKNRQRRRDAGDKTSKQSYTASRAYHAGLFRKKRRGKVAKPSSVTVEKLMSVERYSHVMHLSSTVTGELRADLSCWDALRAALPVGTVSGAPKVRAMELIDELEVTRRGPYSGGFGGISFNGDMDIALGLRTILFPTGAVFDTMYSYVDIHKKRREWVAHLQAGGGVVADSDPDDEHRECQNKAAGLARAIDLAEVAFLY